MNKKILNVMCLALCATSVLGTTACGGGKVSYDTTKTQLFVQTYDGGYGSEWLERVGDRFETAFADYKLGDKVGVEIVPILNTELGSGVDNNWITNTNEIFFLEQTTYHKMYEKGRFLEITDIMTEKLTQYGESGSIVDKMNPTLVEYYNEGTEENPKYYALNYSNSYEAFMYDEDLFYQQGFYYTKLRDENKSAPTADCLISPETKKAADGDYAHLETVKGTTYWKTTEGEYLSHGPDGKYGTQDDGQPATYDEFFALLDYIKDESGGVTPIIVAGKANTGYFAWLFQQLVADYEGETAMRRNLEFEGVADNLIEVDANGNVTPLPTITLDDSNRLQQYKSAGRYYALKFMEKLFENGGQKYMNTRSFAGSVDQIRAQEYFVYSVKDDEKYALSFDGCWWETEASDTLDTMAENFGSQYAKENRRFRTMSLPKATEEKVGEQSTFYENHFFCAFIRSDIGEKADLAKKFLQFCFTDESNSEFTAYTGVTRPFDYEIMDKHKGEMSYFAKDSVALANNENVNIVYPAPDSQYYFDNYDMITGLGLASIHLNGHDYDSLLEMFYTKKFSAETVFNGIYPRAERELG